MIDMPSAAHIALRAKIAEHIERDIAEHEEIREAVLAHDRDTPDEDHTELLKAYIQHVEETNASHERLVALFDAHVAEVDGLTKTG